MNSVNIFFQLLGSIAFLLYGMKLLSDGIQKSAGKGLQNVLSLMTRSRAVGFISGIGVTMLIQSSGATTTMVMSFVNAGLLTLEQSVGVILGANIGTTVTAWIVALFVFNFNVISFAVPVFGLGFILCSIRKNRKDTIGQALMGFGLLFIGLSWLSRPVVFDSGIFAGMNYSGGWNLFNTVAAVCIGLLLTALIRSSSAVTAVIVTLTYNGMMSWKCSAALVIGSSVGSTIDAVLASYHSRTDAKRSAFIHVMVNAVMAVLAVIFFNPLLRFIDFIVPGTPESNSACHVAFFYTFLKTVTALVFLPFTKQLTRLSCRVIKKQENEIPNFYRLEFVNTGMKNNNAAYIIRAEKEISDLTNLAFQMFSRVKAGVLNRSPSFVTENFDALKREENYADQMKEQLSKYLVLCSRLPVSDRQANNLSLMLQIVGDLEDMTDDCFSAAVLLRRSIEKKMEFREEDTERLVPFINLAEQSLLFVKEHVNHSLTAEEFTRAREIEDQIDLFRRNLKKVARKRLTGGADVKTELVYIDLVRQIEKIGDRAFSIAASLNQLN